MNDAPLFPVVIPTLNEGSMLSMTVDNIVSVTDYPNFEVIVIDDGSTDGSCDAYGEATPQVRVVRSERIGIPRARNLGAEHARGAYVLFIDAHCTVSPNWLRRFADALAPSDVALIGPTFTRLHEPEPRGCGNVWINHRLESAWLEPLATDRPYEVPITPGGCQAFRAKTFAVLGGFETGFTRWGYQDEEIHMHFSPPRIRRCIAALGNYPGLEDAIDRLYATDIFQKRGEMIGGRRVTEEWLFRAFMPALAVTGWDVDTSWGGSTLSDRSPTASHMKRTREQVQTPVMGERFPNVARCEAREEAIHRFGVGVVGHRREATFPQSHHEVGRWRLICEPDDKA
jgi:glycosyltransferase involved in cell wall biosynthesis